MIYIVIPVFGRLTYTRECLLSLFEQRFKDFKAIVVDHGTTDETTDMIKAEFPDVILIKGSSSLWWTGATNLGVKEALKLSEFEDDFILSLNNDLVVKQDYLEQLLKVYELNKPCLVGSTSVYYSNHERVQFAGISWNAVLAKFKRSPLVTKSYSSLPADLLFVQSDLLTGRGTLIPINAFKKLGIYDEDKFPHYAADEDYSLVCKRNNYKLLVALKAVVYSHVEDTGLNFNHQKITFKQFTKTLSSIKSANNLTIRYRWAKKNSAFPLLYFSIDVLRISGSYFRSVLKK